MLSVIIITKNEEVAIGACLDSVAWADEIVVLDSGSSDGTVDICRRYTNRVYETDWPGFGPQKNRALDKASGSWILSIDADERITPALKEEILKVIAGPGAFDAYEMPRLSSFCGRPIRYSGWWPDYITRLVRKGRSRFSDDLVHERLVVEGKTGRLSNPILHEAFESLEDVIDTMNRYTTAGAHMMRRRGEKSSLLRAVSHGLWAFLYTYIGRGGFMDGREGFLVALYNGEHSFYRYAKRLYLEDKEP
ncbi:MAG: glycosyltransferase family 2 protein [Syntrophales bacterium]|nr:glycosyltransferase family 2 protein [Syntrophales bacterium]